MSTGFNDDHAWYVSGLLTVSGQQRWTSIAKLDFSTQGSSGRWALHGVIMSAATLPPIMWWGGTAYVPGMYACISGLWGVPLTQVHSHLLSNSIDNQDGQLPRSRYNRVGFMFVSDSTLKSD